MAIKRVNTNTIDEAINDAKPCLIIFSREDCHVCKEVVPRVEDLSEKFEGKVSFYDVDVEEDKNLLKKYSLKGVPQLLFFKEGDFYGKLAGDVEEEDIEEKIEELI